MPQPHLADAPTPPAREPTMHREWPAQLARLMPGVLLASGLGVLAWVGARAEQRLLGHQVIEALVLAILIGMAVRSVWPLAARAEAGVQFTAKQVLEVAVLLLGASVDLPLLVRAGPALAIGIVLVVVIGLLASLAIGRAMGLPAKLAVLVACGNAICGNSAIAAVAPVIGAQREHVASSIAFTAILGVAVVLGLPLLLQPLGLDFYQYGVLAGLTVYAVPQVLAATFPVSELSGEVGTLVKLVRVLMLGPVVLFFALRYRGRAPGQPLAIGRMVPWFIVGFLLLAALRSAGAIPAGAAAVTKSISSWLTIAAMAALGLGVDVRALRRVGRPVILTVSASLLVLLVLSVTLIRLLGIR
jgi:uncharacterized integral membrane protein (TIGR00698 family)